MIVMKS
jgi:hypothetical protein